MRFTHTLKSMHNDINRDKVWKNRMIALNDMPLMTTKELHIYFSYS